MGYILDVSYHLYYTVCMSTLLMAYYSGQVTGWTGIIRVDGTSYPWLGAPLGFPDLANQTSAEYTSTSSIFTFNIDGKVSVKVTFLSPIYPNDQKRQSLIFSYMDVEVTSTDGQSHDTQLYSDISAGRHSPDESDWRIIDSIP